MENARKPKLDPFKVLALVFIVALAASFFWTGNLIQELGTSRKRIAQQTDAIVTLQKEAEARKAADKASSAVVAPPFQVPAPRPNDFPEPASAGTVAISDSVRTSVSAPATPGELNRRLSEKRNELLELTRADLRESLQSSPSENYDRIGGEIEAQNRVVQALDFQISGYRDQLTLLDLQEKDQKQRALDSWKFNDQALAKQIEDQRAMIGVKVAQSNELKSRLVEWQTVTQYRALDEEIARDTQVLQQLSERRRASERAQMELQATTSPEMLAARQEAQAALQGLVAQRELEVGRLAALQQDLFQASDSETNRELQATIRDTDRRRLEQEISTLQAQLNQLENAPVLAE